MSGVLSEQRIAKIRPNLRRYKVGNTFHPSESEHPSWLSEIRLFIYPWQVLIRPMPSWIWDRQVLLSNLLKTTTWSNFLFASQRLVCKINLDNLHKGRAMTVAKVLRLNDKGVVDTMKHPQLLGKIPIHRGVFSAIFDDKWNTVLKLTADGASYAMLNGKVRVKNRHFPQVHKDYREVGEMVIANYRLPLFLYEVEKLQPLQKNSIERNMAYRLGTMQRKWTYEDYCGNESSISTVHEMSMDEKIPVTIREALAELRDFIKTSPNNRLDMHLGNFMQRANGELVITDPIFDAFARNAGRVCVF